MATRQSISVSFTPQQAEFLASCVASGRYPSTSEVVREAVPLLEYQLASRGSRTPGRALRDFVVSKSFIVVYEPTGHGLRVARLLHGGRNLAAELEREPGETTATTELGGWTGETPRSGRMASRSEAFEGAK